MGWITKFLGFKQKKQPVSKPLAKPSQPSVQPSKPSLSKVSKGVARRKKPSKPSIKPSEPSKATKTKVSKVSEDRQLVVINKQLES